MLHLLRCPTLALKTVVRQRYLLHKRDTGQDWILRYFCLVHACTQYFLEEVAKHCYKSPIAVFDKDRILTSFFCRATYCQGEGQNPKKAIQCSGDAHTASLGRNGDCLSLSMTEIFYTDMINRKVATSLGLQPHLRALSKLIA